MLKALHFFLPLTITNILLFYFPQTGRQICFSISQKEKSSDGQMHGPKSLILKTCIVLADNQLKDILFLKIKVNVIYAAAAGKSLQSV